MKKTFMFLIYFSLEIFAVEHVHSAYGSADPEMGQRALSFHIITIYHCCVAPPTPLPVPPRPKKPKQTNQNKPKKINKYILLSYFKKPPPKQRG